MPTATSALIARSALPHKREEETDEEILEKLEAHDPLVRRVTLESLVIKGPETAARFVDEVLKQFGAQESDVRAAAAYALVKAGPVLKQRSLANCAAVAAKALGDDDGRVRAEATRALAALGREATLRFVDKIVALEKDQDEDVKLAAITCISTVGEASRLGPFLRSADSLVCRAALLEVGRCPAARLQHAEILARQLFHQDALVRLAAVQASGELGSNCSDIHLQALSNLQVVESQVKVRRAAVQALGRCGEAGARYLTAFLRDRDEMIRHFAAETLAAVGGEASASSAALLLEDSDPVVQQAALLAIGRLGDAGLCHSSAVAKQLLSENLGNKLAAIQALNELGASNEASGLGGLVDDHSKAVRQAAVAALAKMGAVGAAEATKFLRDQDPSVRQAAVKVFSPLHSKLPASIARTHVQTLACGLLDEDWRVRMAVVVALGDLQADEMAEQVAALRNDENDQVRRSAVTALVKMGAVPALAAAFLGDEDAEVRRDAAEAFATLGGQRADDEISEAD